MTNIGLYLLLYTIAYAITLVVGHEIVYRKFKKEFGESYKNLRKQQKK